MKSFTLKYVIASWAFIFCIICTVSAQIKVTNGKLKAFSGSHVVFGGNVKFDSNIDLDSVSCIYLNGIRPQYISATNDIISFTTPLIIGNSTGIHALNDVEIRDTIHFNNNAFVTLPSNNKWHFTENSNYLIHPNSVSYIDGIVKKTGNTAFVFPLGSQQKTAFSKISAPTNSSDSYEMTFISSSLFEENLHQTNAVTYSQNNNGYWNFSKKQGASLVQLSLEIPTHLTQLNCSKAMVLEDVGSKWKAEGNGGKIGNFITLGTGIEDCGTPISDFENGNYTTGVIPNCNGIVCAFPYHEDFEASLGYWTPHVTQSNGFRWIRSAHAFAHSKERGPKKAHSGYKYLALDYAINPESTGSFFNYLECSFEFVSLQHPVIELKYHHFNQNYINNSLDYVQPYIEVIYNNDTTKIYSQTSERRQVRIDYGSMQRQDEPYKTVLFDLQQFAGKTNVKVRLVMDIDARSGAPYYAFDDIIVREEITNNSQIVSQYPYTESFETSWGAWNNTTSESKIDWTRTTLLDLSTNSSTEARNTRANSGSFFVYLDPFIYPYTDQPTVTNGTSFSSNAFLEATFDFSLLDQPLFEFWYKMTDIADNELFVEIEHYFGIDTVFFLKNIKTEHYQRALIDLNKYGLQNLVTIRVKGKSSSSANPNARMILDLLKVGNIEHFSVPVHGKYYENFENQQLSWGITNYPYETLNYTWDISSNVSNTNISAFQGEQFASLMQTTSSVPSAGNQSSLIQIFDLTELENPQLTFQLYKRGDNSGYFYTELDTGGGFFVIDRKINTYSSVENQWDTIKIALNPYLISNKTVKIRFRSVYKNTLNTGYNNSVAIDQIEISGNECETVNAGTAQVKQKVLLEKGAVGLKLTGQDDDATVLWEISRDNLSYSTMRGVRGAESLSKIIHSTGVYFIRAKVLDQCIAYSDPDTVYVMVSPDKIDQYNYQESFESDFGTWHEEPSDRSNDEWISFPTTNETVSTAKHGSKYAKLNADGKSLKWYGFFDLSYVSSPSLNFSHYNYKSFGTGAYLYLDILDHKGIWHKNVWNNEGTTSNTILSSTNWRDTTISLQTYKNSGDGMILRFRSETTNSSILYLDNIQVTGISIAKVDTTIWTGATNTNWSTSTNWSNGIPKCDVSALISKNSSSSYPVINSTANVHHLIIEDSTSITVNREGILNICGNWTNNGDSKLGDGTVNFQGLNRSIITGNNVFSTLVINNSNHVEIDSNAKASIRNWLSIITGTLYTSDQLTLLSNTDTSASITSIGDGANILGNVIVQRHISDGKTGWRFMTSPVQDVTVADWKDDFYMTGFTGSHDPSYWFTSIYSFDETSSGSFNQKFKPVTNITHQLEPGDGFYVWSGTATTESQSFMTDLTGHVNKGQFRLPVSRSGSSANDGWCLVGNPYPSVIDWLSDEWVKEGVSENFYIWNTNLRQFAAYTIDAGTGIEGYVNEGSRYIASGQAVFIKATSDRPQLIANEDVKIKRHRKLLRSSSSKAIELALTLKQDQKHQDEAKINFNNLSSNWNVTKLKGNSTLSNISFIKNNQEWALYSTDTLAVNQFKLNFKNTDDKILHLHSKLSEKTPDCVYLKDELSNEIFNLKEQNTPFLLNNEDINSRYSIYAGNINPRIIIENENCSENAGKIDANLIGASFQLLTENSQLLASGSDQFSAENLTAGTYILETTIDGCETSRKEIPIISTKVNASIEVDNHYILGDPLQVRVLTDNQNEIIYLLNNTPISPGDPLLEPGIFELIVRVSNGICIKVLSELVNVNKILATEPSINGGDWGIGFRNKQLYFFNTRKTDIEGRWKLVALDGSSTIEHNQIFLESHSEKLFNLPSNIAKGIYVLIFSNKDFSEVKTLKFVIGQ